MFVWENSSTFQQYHIWTRSFKNAMSSMLKISKIESVNKPCTFVKKYIEYVYINFKTHKLQL